MRVIPRSLWGSIHGRMITLSVIATLVALAVAAVAIGGVLERFVTQSLDRRLDADLALLASAVDDGGRIDRNRLARVRGALDTGPGWTWRIAAPSESVGTADFPDLAPARPAPATPPRGEAPPPHAVPDDGGAQPLEGRDRHGRVHARTLALPIDDGTVVITAAAPRAVVARPVRAALAPLLAALGILGILLAAAILVQVRLGLKPLRTLRDGVAAIRAGDATILREDQPYELRPLAAELNALVADNSTALATARASAASLAHGLKTPVATLGLALAEPGRDPDGSLSAQLARIDATVRHHLARARSVVTDTRATTPLRPALDDLVAAMRRLHANRGIAVHVDVPDVSVAIGAQDLDELIGNLLDNAVRHARTSVAITTTSAPRRLLLSIADDGAGIPSEDRARAIDPGIRLDERADGHGFGLAIARDLATLYGGQLRLDEAPGGGLIATAILLLVKAD